MSDPVRFWNKAAESLGSGVTSLTYRAQSKAKALAFAMDSFNYNKPVYPLNNFYNAVKRGYRLNELIYSAITVKANTVASVSLKVYDKKSHEEIEDHPLKELLDHPNDVMTGSDLMRMRIIYQQLAGRAYFEKVRDNTGKVRELWPLRPDWLVPVRGDGNKFLTKYQYSAGGQAPIDVPAKDILDLGLYDPLDLYESLAPLQVAARAVDVDNSATDFIKMFWERGAMIPGIITTKLRIDDKDAREIAARFSEKYGGFTKWNDVAVLDQDASYQKIGQNFQEMSFESLDMRNEARICMVMQIPAVIVGAFVGIKHSTFSNFEQARRVWWEDTLVPDYKYFTDQINHFLTPEFDPNVYVKVDTSEVPALQENIDSAWKRATDAFNSGFASKNDARREVGLEETDDGNVYKIANTFILLDEKNMRVARDENPDDPTQEVNTDYLDPENPTESEKPPESTTPGSDNEDQNTTANTVKTKSAKQSLYSDKDKQNLIKLFAALPTVDKLIQHANSLKE